MVEWLHDKHRVQGTRIRQEDDYGVFEVPPQLEAGDLLLVLADGMGGEQAGAFASTLAVQNFIDIYVASTVTTIPKRLEDTLHRVNEKMALAVAANPENLRGMGCTLLAVVLAEEGMYWISVGDSPLWRWRRGRLRRLNQDHSYRSVLAEQVRSGELTPEEAATHPCRNALVSAVTGEALELVDLSHRPYALRPDDQVLLASDGIFTLGEQEISTILTTAGAHNAPCQPLLAAVISRQNPQQDNTTVIWAKHAPIAATMAFWRQPWVWRRSY